jgi:hypothetical protein
MEPFAQEWHDKYMKNAVTAETLQKLVGAGKLSAEDVEAWIAERKAVYGV